MTGSLTTRLLVLISVLCCTTPAYAQLQWNFFGTVGFGQVDEESVVSNSNLAYSDLTENFSGSQLTRLGVQPSYRINDDLSLTLQAVTRLSEDFDAEIEWGYLNFSLSHNTTLRLGLIRRPLFQYTDSLYVGYGSRWVQPPSTAYVDIDEFYGNIRAINLLYNGAWRDWLYSSEVYFGQGTGEGSFAGQTTSNNTKHNLGAVINLEQDHFSLRFGLHESNFSLAIDQIDTLGQALKQFGLFDLADDVLLQNETVHFYSIGGSYLTGGWEIFGEKVVADIRGTYIPKIEGWYLGFQRSFNNVALHFTAGEQTTDPQLDPSADILALAAQLPDPEAAASLNAVGLQLAPVVEMSNSRRFSKSLGVRVDVSSRFAFKAEVEQVTDKLIDKKANLFSISVDFVF
ncbi:MAG: hypothetical protein AAF404_02645 [Pseudomonadota bacterium]